jgi:hypothetical protein
MVSTIRRRRLGGGIEGWRRVAAGDFREVEGKKAKEKVRVK